MAALDRWGMLRRVSGAVLVSALLGFACSAGSDDDTRRGSGSGSGGAGAGGFAGGTGMGGATGDPKNCSEAEGSKSYLGCVFWPTPVANNVWSVFDFAVVVANAGDMTAEVKVTRGLKTVASDSVPPNALRKIYLPWVPELKGPDADDCGTAQPLSETVRVDGGAYRLESTRPVTVYQFNALEYKGEGGPAGKSWSSCPGSSPCSNPGNPSYGNAIGCYSFSNDASLLLPENGLTGSYRVAGQHGWTAPAIGGYVAITATRNGTDVTVQVSKAGQVQAGGGIAAASAGQTIQFSMDAGDVVQLMGGPSDASDLSGSVVLASKPVQVIAGTPCIQHPIGSPACDHTEESVFPGETLGKHYIVTVPTGPNGNVVGHLVRLFGNVDGTSLVYAGPKPPGAPSEIHAGDVISLGVVKQDFEISGNHAFAVGSYMLGASQLDPGVLPPDQKGDPAQSLATAVEQYRTKYVFLAPDDYDVSYVDVIMPEAAAVEIDGAPLAVTPTPISSGYGVARVKLGPGQSGAHVLTSSEPVGIQIMGYGSYTSYQYPGGLNLLAIAPPPEIPK